MPNLLANLKFHLALTGGVNSKPLCFFLMNMLMMVRFIIASKKDVSKSLSFCNLITLIVSSSHLNNTKFAQHALKQAKILCLVFDMFIFSAEEIFD